MTVDVEQVNILDRLRNGERIRLNDPKYNEINEVVERTIKLSRQLNMASDINSIRDLLSEIIGSGIDESTTIFAPFHTNFGKFITIGKNVFINHGCSFLDMGGITIEDDVLIGPRVNLVTENHPLDPVDRRALLTKPIVIKRNAWIGAGATILPGSPLEKMLSLQPEQLSQRTWLQILLSEGFRLNLLKTFKHEKINSYCAHYGTLLWNRKGTINIKFSTDERNISKKLHHI